MANEYYDSSGAPSTGSALSSAAIRAEFAAIEAAFDILPTLTGNSNEVIVINSGGTGLSSVAITGSIVDTGSTQTLTNKTIDAASNTLTNVVTLTGSQTLTNKTLTSPVINTPTGIVKGDVGLGNVDNTSDATKNAAAATLTNKTLTSPVINTPTGIVKGDVGLGNVDNTSDATKNAASATLTNKTLTNPSINGYTEGTYVPSAGTAFTVDLANGTLQKLTTSGNVTITLPTPAAGKSYTLMVQYGGTHTLTWAGGGTRRWDNGTEPAATSVNGKVDTFVFRSVDATDTFCGVGGQNA